jgi:hypothetical protein
MGIKDTIKAVSLSLICLLGMILLFNLILHYPVKGQLYVETKPKASGYAPLEIEAQVKNPIPIWEQHAKKIEKLPAFVPPADAHLTEDQIHRYYQVVEHCWSRLGEFKNVYLGAAKSGFGKAALMYAYAPVMYELCRIEGLDLAQMREEEFEWVKSRLFEAALFALNRKMAKDKMTAEEKDTLVGMRNQLCIINGLYKDANPPEYYPEKLEVSRIPRHNIDLFLRFKNEARFRRVNFNKVEFDYQDVMKAAQDLPE